MAGNVARVGEKRNAYMDSERIPNLRDYLEDLVLGGEIILK